MLGLRLFKLYLVWTGYPAEFCTTESWNCFKKFCFQILPISLSIHYIFFLTLPKLKKSYLTHWEGIPYM